MGDRVTICPDVVCGECWFCKNMPSYPWCEKAKFHYGHNRSTTEGKQLYGGFSQYMYIEPGARLYKIPDGLPNDLACFTEVMCVTYTLEKAREFSSFDLEGFNFGDAVVVQDCGAEIVVECVGRPEVFPEGLKYLRKAGMYLEQAARFRPSRKTAVRLKKTGGHGASTPSSRICTIKSVACQTIPHLFFSINKTRSTD